MKITNTTFLLFVIVPVLFFGCNQQSKKTKHGTPEEIISTRTLGVAYLEENQLDKAEVEFRKLIELDPESATGYANLGLVFLRKGKYSDAEAQLLKAIDISPEDPDIRLILAKTYELNNKKEDAVKVLEKSVQYAPDHIKSLFSLTELYSLSADKNSAKKRLLYTKQQIEKAPGNIVPRLNLIEILIRHKKVDDALAELEKLQKIFPEFPKEAIEYYKKTMVALQEKNIDEASVSFMIFHNYMKVTGTYQSGVLELKGPGGSAIGTPLITFDKNESKVQAGDWKAVLKAIHFTDVTSQVGLDFGQSKNNLAKQIPLAACDFDGDNDIDFYLGYFDKSTNSYKYGLFKNDEGKFTNVSKEAGITPQNVEYAAKFNDFDNDGFPDLYVICGHSNILYKNNGDGTFTNVSAKANVGVKTAGNRSLFFDYDHDGDLDLFILQAKKNILYRNNSDGTFSDRSEESGLAGDGTESLDAAFGDFDDDGDIDLFVVNGNSPDELYSNQRQGIFREVTGKSGLKKTIHSTSVSVGDYNNDGFFDLFITSSVPGENVLYRNLGDGTFKEDKQSSNLEQTLKNVAVNDASFFDFDNDGFLDLLVAGTSKTGGDGVFLLHNDGNGMFYNTENILPGNLKEGKQILTFDYGNDGDLDFLIVQPGGSVRLLRNDGGNNNHFVKIKLVGLRTGSGKNNYYGIGTKVEMRAGNLYQSKVVTTPSIHFGLGARTKAEVIRVLWTNGVPQNIFFPGTDQSLIEEQSLKGSCPFLYSWDGEKYVFVKDIMWRSALGMPLGIMGGDKAMKYASPAPSDDYIKIPSELIKPQNGKYIIQTTAELWETIYTDQIQLVAIDHPASTDVYVDERILPSATPGYKLFQAKEKKIPLSATNKRNDNLLEKISKKDDKYVSEFIPAKYQGITELTYLTLDLGEIDPDKKLTLFLNGWIFPSDASINASISQSDELEIVSPQIQAVDKNGRWKTVVNDLTFPMGKDKTIVVDLTGKVFAKDARIRIKTNMEIYWDYIFYTNENCSEPVNATVLAPVAADLHYRGFSRTFRKGGRYGPHWFDYYDVSTEQKWRDLLGNYTRYGDVLPLLIAPDNKYIVKNAGDETTITFDAARLPELPEGWKRDFLIHSVGWVKDGDMNTATGKNVEPLPFREMSCYPYGSNETYPTDSEHQEYLKKYNTRKVTTKNFRRVLSDVADASK